MSKLIKLSALMLSLGVICGANAAGTQTADMKVRLTVVESCKFTADDLDFGSHSIDSTDILGETKLYVTCTAGTEYSIVRDAADLKLAHSSEAATIDYELYSDSSRNTEFGADDGKGIDGMGNGTEQVIPLYGKVPNLVSAAAGDYSDTVTLTVSY